MANIAAPTEKAVHFKLVTRPPRRPAPARPPRTPPRCRAVRGERDDDGDGPRLLGLATDIIFEGVIGGRLTARQKKKDVVPESGHRVERPAQRVAPRPWRCTWAAAVLAMIQGQLLNRIVNRAVRQLTRRRREQAGTAYRSATSTASPAARSSVGARLQDGRPLSLQVGAGQAPDGAPAPRAAGRYRAGRYGPGPADVAQLRRMGRQRDTSVAHRRSGRGLDARAGGDARCGQAWRPSTSPTAVPGRSPRGRRRGTERQGDWG